MKLRFKITGLILALCLVCMTFGGDKISAQNYTKSERSEKAKNKWTPILDQEMSRKGLKLGSSIFLRLTKTTSAMDGRGYLEAFIESETGTYDLFKKWEICTYSGELGPKLREGDRQSPEGFYFVKPSQMNPNSSYHLSFNLGFPNAYDRAYNRTGSFLMVHGDCVSIGCYAMTDVVIEEIYTLMSAAFDNGQPFIRVHIFPFPMTDENLKSVSDNNNFPFWQNLQEGWDAFEANNIPPNVGVSEQRYVFESSH